MKTVISLVRQRLYGPGGHVYWTTPNEPLDIVDEMLPLALAQGCVEVKDPLAPAEVKVTESPSDEVTESLSPDTQVYQLVAAVMKRGNPDDFKIDGSPKLAAVRAEYDGDVPPKLVTQDRIYKAYMEILAEEKIAALASGE